ncbi:MAG: 30S ribosomal protein S12 methylthiotransferase RimO [Acidobacteriota bacterium]
MTDRRVALIHLGCAKNLVDSEAMLGRVLGPGVSLTTTPGEADVVIVNTCSFIGPSKKESVDAILEAARLKQEGRCERLIVAGCMVERYRDELASEIPEVDAFVAANDIPRIAEVAFGELAPERNTEPEYVYDFEAPRVLSTPAGTAYVKIADGCDHACSFCAIPRIRGRLRSRAVARIAGEVRDLVARGVLEVNLVSHDTTDYGRDLGMRDGLATLLDALRQIPGLAWLRVLYLYPTNLSARVIAMLGEGAPLLPYFDVPLQHAHPKVLRSMARGLSVERTVERIRATVPGASIRTTLIVGYPGEGDEEFAALERFVAASRFDRVGVFTFSFEEGVPAEPLADPIPERVKRARRKRLMEVQRRVSLEKNRALVGTTGPCLLLGLRDGRRPLWGRLPSQAPEVDGIVAVSAAPDVPFPAIVDVAITGAGAYDLTARVA